MDDEIQAEKLASKADGITAKQPSPSPSDDDNPFKLPGKQMGPVRKRIMVVGFLVLFFLGLSMSTIFMKNPFVQCTFLTGSVVYFVWLAQWTTWKRQ